MAEANYPWSPRAVLQAPKVAYRGIAPSTNARTMVATLLDHYPAGHSVFFFRPSRRHLEVAVSTSAWFCSLVFDHHIRVRLVGTNLSEFVMVECALPSRARSHLWARWLSTCLGLFAPSSRWAHRWLCLAPRFTGHTICALWDLTQSRRCSAEANLHAVAYAAYGLDDSDVRHITSGCDHPSSALRTSALRSSLDPRGFWRVDKDKPPELRQTVLALVAFHDLQQKIEAAGGDVDKGIEAFLNQNDGEGWMLPETLRLADYGLGHDERAKEHQPVRACFGPRFYDWQLVQSAEESWRECHLHARNLLGEEGYRTLLVEILTTSDSTSTADHREATLRYARAVLGEAGYQRLLAELAKAAEPPAEKEYNDEQTPPGTLFDTGDMPLFQRKREG